MKKLTLIIAVLFIAISSHSQTVWNLAGENGAGDKFYVDSDVRSTDGDFVISTWVKVVYNKYTKEKGKYSLQKYEFDIDKKQYRIMAILFYSKSDKLIDRAEWTDLEADWSVVAPESVGEILLLASRYFYRKANTIH